MLELLEIIFGVLELVVDATESRKRAKLKVYDIYPDHRPHYSDWERNHPANFR